MTGLIRRVERAVLPQVQRPTDLTAPSAMAGTEALAQGLQDVGDLFQEWQNDIDTADAMAADAAFTERANDLLYNDTTGFMYSEGSNATSGRNGAVTALEEARESILGQLSTGARVRAEGPLGARAESMITRVNQHTGQQRLSYLQQAADARVAASINTAIAEPDSINEQYGIAINTLRDRAAREGWPAERLALEEQGVADNIILGNIRRISATDPEQALELLRANEARLSGVGLAEAEERLLPAAMEARGQRLGRVAATGASPDPLQISGNMSSQPAIYDRVAQAWAYVMPPGSQIVVSSAHRPNGSATSQHHSGDAIDYHVTRPDGSRVQWDDPEALAAARFGAALGVRGVGAGFDYMGGDHFHWDLGQNPNNVRGGIQVWTDSDGVNNRDPRGAVSWIEDLRAAEAMGVDGLLEEMGASSEPITMTDLLARLDGQPDAVRDAAIREYELRIGASAHDERVAHEDLMDAANALVINGGSVTDLDIDVRQALSAEGLQQAYALERMIASGAAPSTDPQTYVDLTRMMSDDPEQFEEIDMIEFATTLTQSDFERFVTLQGQMRAARRGQGGDVPDIPSVSTLMSTADSRLRAVGITNTGPHANPEMRADFQSRLTRWAVENPNLANNPAEVDRWINMQLTQIVTGGAYRDGARSQTRPLFAIDFGGQTITTADDLDHAQIDRMISRGGMSINGEVVTAEAASQVYMDLFVRLNGGDISAIDLSDMSNPSLNQPTPEQLVRGLTAFYQ